MKPILIVGNGWLGNRIHKAIESELFIGRNTSFDGWEKTIDIYQPETIINCVGHTGRKNTDDCLANPDKTLFANSFTPVYLAEVCIRQNIKLVQLSTGCIFKSNASETGQPDFTSNFYARSKIYSDMALQPLVNDYNILMLRLRLPFDIYPHPKNLLTKLLGYKSIITAYNSITYVPDFIEVLREMLTADYGHGISGIYNVVNPGALSYLDLLAEYQTVAKKEVKIDKVEPAWPNRTDVVLDISKLIAMGYKMKPIEQVIKEGVKLYVENESRRVS